MAHHSALWWSSCATCVWKCENIAGSDFDISKVDLWKLLSLLSQRIKIKDSEAHFVQFTYCLVVDSVVKNHILDSAEVFQSRKDF